MSPSDVKLDPRTLCPKCRKNPLRSPLVFNPTDPETGLYWCKGCDTAGTVGRLQAVTL